MQTAEHSFFSIIKWLKVSISKDDMLPSYCKNQWLREQVHHTRGREILTPRTSYTNEMKP